MDHRDEVIGAVGVEQGEQDPEAEDDGHDVRDDRHDGRRLVASVAITS
ncbi:hypothetical protein ACFQ10_17825 [Streptomyces indonesiensis]